jgi:acyl carrier protein
MAPTITKDEVGERVTSALVEFGASPDEVTRDAELEALEIDSLDLVELGQIVEEEYGTRLRGEDMEGMRTVGDAIDLIVSRIR